MSRLIVNADDMGYTGGVNRAIVELHAAGALSSATAMATSPALLSGMPAKLDTLGVGCHVVLVDGLPAAPPDQIPSLVSPAGNGRFRSSLGNFVVDLLRGRIRDRDLEAEAIAQIRALQARGIRLTHVDTHKHTHMFPRVLRPLLRAALQCGIPAVRNPFEPVWAQAATEGASLLRRMEVRALSGFCEGFLREVDRAGLRTTAGALGVLATGGLDTAVLDRLLAALERHAAATGRQEECYELVCHPGFHDVELDAQRTRLRAERETERLALLHLIPAYTTAAGPHRLVTFADL